MNWLYGQFLEGRSAIGLLVLRVVAGAGLMFHGWPKIQNPMGWMGPEAPVPGILQLLAAVAEFFGGLGLIVGLLTPIAAFGILCVMLVAITTVHMAQGDPFVGKGPKGGSWELAALYLAVAAVMLFAGPGALSIDRFVFGRNRTEG